MDVSQYMGMFLEESIENLQILNESLLELEKNPKEINKLNKIFRIVHTIKGMSATMGFNMIGELTHKMEDVLEEFKNGRIEVTQIAVTILFDCLDRLEKMIDTIEENTEKNIGIDDLIERLDHIKKEKSIGIEKIDKMTKLNEYDLSIIREAIQRGYNALSLTIILSKTTLLKSARAFLIVKELESKGEIIKSNPSTEKIENEEFDFLLEFILLTKSSKNKIEQLVSNISEVENINIDNVKLDDTKKREIEKKEEIKIKEINQEEKQENVKKVHQSVRVDLEKIDNLMNMVSELVIYRTRLEQIVTKNKIQELNETLEQVARTTSELQDLVMKIRMLPLEIVFNRFPRMIRDISIELNKEINFILEGAETQLDRTVIDEIGEPLIHLLRNAADHGIEKREERIKNGKNPVGIIKLQAYQEGTKALIKVIDDGAGINIKKVRNKAEKLGFYIEGMNKNEIQNLIFEQGFSTNDIVTDISGRGIGMDVVKTKIISLGGSLELTSEEGIGSTFTIKLPLTLQIIQALLITVGKETFAISLGFIDRVINYNKEEIKKTNGREVIMYKGEVIRLIRLNEKLQIEASNKEKKFVIIVKVGDKTFGLFVDSLIGQQEIVIKPLGKTLKSLKEYIGATILGNGLVTLILDIGALY